MSVEEALVCGFAREDRTRRANNLSLAAAARTTTTTTAMGTAARMRRVVAVGHGVAAAASSNKKVREKALVSSAEIYGSRRVDGNLKF